MLVIEPTDTAENADGEAGIARSIASLLEASRRHDAAACAALFAEDATLVSPFGPTVTGRADVEATHEAWFAEGETNKRMDVLEVRASGDVGYCLVAWSGDYAQADGAVVTERGRSLNAMERGADGTWRIRVCSLNSDEPSG